MVNKLTVLVAGFTGMLGSKIVSALLDKGDVDVRAMWCAQLTTTMRKIAKKSTP